MWAARDEDGTLHLFDIEPERIDANISGGKTKPIWSNDDGENMELDYFLFPDLKWEDEPIEVNIVLKEYLNCLEVIQDEYEKVNDAIHLKRFKKDQKENIDKSEAKKS